MKASHWNISGTLKVSSSAVAKTIKRYDESGPHEDRQRKGRPSDLCCRGSSFELSTPQIVAQINLSVQLTDIKI
jgi:hypothetical protein